MMLEEPEHSNMERTYRHSDVDMRKAVEDRDPKKIQSPASRKGEIYPR